MLRTYVYVSFPAKFTFRKSEMSDDAQHTEDIKPQFLDVSSVNDTDAAPFPSTFSKTPTPEPKVTQHAEVLSPKSRTSTKSTYRPLQPCFPVQLDFKDLQGSRKLKLLEILAVYMYPVNAGTVICWLQLMFPRLKRHKVLLA